ncbi:hypothetical protein LguiA_034616 [Lonicera macranthoides]
MTLSNLGLLLLCPTTHRERERERERERHALAGRRREFGGALHQNVCMYGMKR